MLKVQKKVPNFAAVMITLQMMQFTAVVLMLLEHPDWNVDAVAEHCGFASRTILHRKFKEATRLLPVEYQKSR